MYCVSTKDIFQSGTSTCIDISMMPIGIRGSRSPTPMHGHAPGTRYAGCTWTQGEHVSTLSLCIIWRLVFEMFSRLCWFERRLHLNMIIMHGLLWLFLTKKGQDPGIKASNTQHHPCKYDVIQLQIKCGSAHLIWLIRGSHCGSDKERKITDRVITNLLPKMDRTFSITLLFVFSFFLFYTFTPSFLFLSLQLGCVPTSVVTSV